MDKIVEKTKKTTCSKNPGTYDDKLKNVDVLKHAKHEEKAELFYRQTRQSTNDVIEIAQNTGVPTEVIQNVKKHVFINKHILDGDIRRFYPDLDMMDAWERLTNGDFVQADLLWLQHEYAESLIMSGQKMDWRTAHDIINESYNWYEYLKTKGL